VRGLAATLRTVNPRAYRNAGVRSPLMPTTHPTPSPPPHHLQAAYPNRPFFPR
jgi:hypothetical protein